MVRHAPKQLRFGLIILVVRGFLQDHYDTQVFAAELDSNPEAFQEPVENLIASDVEDDAGVWD
jgi:hypothetical protein